MFEFSSVAHWFYRPWLSSCMRNSALFNLPSSHGNSPGKQQLCDVAVTSRSPSKAHLQTCRSSSGLPLCPLCGLRSHSPRGCSTALPAGPQGCPQPRASQPLGHSSALNCCHLASAVSSVATEGYPSKATCSQASLAKQLPEFGLSQSSSPPQLKGQVIGPLIEMLAWCIDITS